MRSKLHKEGTEAADKFAKILAKYAEKAYLPKDVNVRQSNIVTNSISIRELQAVFLLTSTGKLFFSHTFSLLLDVKTGKKQLEDAMLGERRAREATAAQVSIYMNI